jgi:iron(III) transport system substrate-binding protein
MRDRARSRTAIVVWYAACAAAPATEELIVTREERLVPRRRVMQLGLGLIGSSALASVFAPRAQAAPDDDEDKLVAEARKEKAVVWWTSHYALSAAEAVRDAFVARYPGIEVQFIRQTAQVVYQRLSQNLKAGVREVDVFASTDASHYLALKSQGVLAPYTPPGVSSLPKAFRSIDPDGMYHTGAIGLVLINYNPKIGAPPQKWTELLDPKWQGQITLGHPGFSGYVGNWVVAMMDKYGWEYFVKLAKNKPKIARSVNDTVADIVGGERQVGAGPDNLSLEQKARGNPIDIHFPADDAVLIVSPVGILANAPHPSAARLFERFYFTKEYSQAMAKTFNYPLRPDVPPPSGVPIDKVKWHWNKVDRLEKAVPEAIAKWRETFGV